MDEDKRIRVGIVGFGVIGKATAKAVTKNKDLELVAIFSKRDPKTLQNAMAKVYPTDTVAEFQNRIDVMIICDTFGTGLQEETPEIVKMFHTVDSHPLRGTPPTAEEVEAQRKLRLEELQVLAKDLAERQARREGSADENTDPAAQAQPDDPAAAAPTDSENAPDEGEAAEAEETSEVMGLTLPAFVKEPSFQPVYKTFQNYFAEVNAAGEESKHTSLCAVGWEPGIMSMFRTLAGGIFPKTKTYTFWGRGVSMQWSNAVKAFEGILDAVVYQVPKEEPLTALLNNQPIWDDSRKALHYLEVYAVADTRYDREQLREQIANMPGWFKDYDTQVTFLSPDEMREFHTKWTHAGLSLCKASTSQGINEQLKLEIDMDDNAEFTAYVMACAARAVYRAGAAGWHGAYTMTDLPASWFNPQDPNEARFQQSLS